jgi:hypothetical protein
MNYGDVLEKITYRCWLAGYKGVTFRYRIDPVPGVGGRYNGHWYKRPKTTAEKRQSFADPEFVRPRRNALNLPDAYDDKCRSDLKGSCYSPKSWKNKKIRKQWMKNENSRKNY